MLERAAIDRSRRRFLRDSLGLASLGLLAGCGILPLQGRAPSRVARIGYLGLGPRAATGAVAEAFEQGLRELGYVPGQNLAIEYRYAEGRDEQLPALAAELVRLDVDLLIASGPRATQVATEATDTIPVVMVAGPSDPVGLGLVAGLARPGGNITGLTTAPSQGLHPKGLELLKAAAPGASRMAVLWDTNNWSLTFRSAPAGRRLEADARALGVQLQPLEVGDPTDLEPAFEAATREGAGAVLVAGGAMQYAERARIAGLALKGRLPTGAIWREFAEAGGLMAYGAHLPDLYRRAAAYADKILKGASPADIPIEQPTKFELAINLKTARALGLAIPESVLQQATGVIQ